MREEWRSLKLSVIILIILSPIIALTVLFVSHEYDRMNCEEYLSIYDQNDSLIVIQDDYVLSTSKSVLLEKRFIHATEDLLYVCDWDDRAKEYRVARVDHCGENEEVLFTFKNRPETIVLIDERYLFIEDVIGGYCRYDIETEKLDTISENEMPGEVVSESDYSHEFGDELKYFYSSVTLTRKSDGEKRTLNVDRFKSFDDRYEIVKDVEPGMELAYVFYDNGSVYIGCRLNGAASVDGFLVVYEYDFDSDSISFFGWRGGLWEPDSIRKVDIFILPDSDIDR